jgi:hypothetical protein
MTKVADCWRYFALEAFSLHLTHWPFFDHGIYEIDIDKELSCIVVVSCIHTISQCQFDPCHHLRILSFILSLPQTPTKVVSSNSAQARCTRCNITCLSMTCDRSVVFSEYSVKLGFWVCRVWKIPNSYVFPPYKTIATRLYICSTKTILTHRFTDGSRTSSAIMTKVADCWRYFALEAFSLHLTRYCKYING